MTKVGADGVLLCSLVLKTYSNLHTCPREHSAVTGRDKQDSPKLDAVHHVTTVPAFQKQYSTLLDTVIVKFPSAQIPHREPRDYAFDQWETGANTL